MVIMMVMMVIMMVMVMVMIVIMMSKKQKMQVSASSPNFSMVETDVTTIKLTGLSPNTQVIL